MPNRRDLLKAGASLSALSVSATAQDAESKAVLGASQDQVLTDLSRIVGERWVFTEQDELRRYSDPYSPYVGTTKQTRPRLAIAPNTVEQVQQIVRLANDYTIPFWVVSTGKNWGYGGMDAVVDGSMIIDLKRLNRILEVNEDLAYAVVEPGVSQYELWRHIQDNDIALWVDGPSPPWASVVANTIERGAGYGPLSERFDQVCGMEVILPDGELLRTSTFALPHAKAAHTYKYGIGPWIDGLFSQSNFGIVTKMGIYLNPTPDYLRAGYIDIPRYPDIVPTIDLVNRFRLNGVLQHGTSILLKPPEGYNPFQSGQPPPKPSGVPKMHEGVTLPPPGFGWGVRFALQGHEHRVEADWHVLRSAFEEAIPDVRFGLDSYAHPFDYDRMNTVVKLQGGIPSAQEGEAIWGHGVIFISMLLPASGREYWRYSQEFQELYRSIDMPFLGGVQHFHSRRTIMTLAGYRLDPTDPDHNEKGMEFARQVFATAKKNGWGEYRAPVTLMQAATDPYDFNNHALRRFNERIKDLLDPNGVMSPGKNGIWPRGRRGRV